MINTVVCAAFCGTGKTRVCNQVNISAIEIEYWKYKDKGLQKEYIKDVKNQIGKVDYILISTDPEGLKLLQRMGFDIILVYPENELRNEYLDRYLDRDSPCDFIGAFMKYWNTWLNELKEQTYCKHVVLKSGEYLSDVIDIPLEFPYSPPDKKKMSNTDIPIDVIRKSFEKEYPLMFNAVFVKDHYIVKDENGNEYYPFFNNEFRQYIAGWRAYENLCKE